MIKQNVVRSCRPHTSGATRNTGYGWGMSVPVLRGETFQVLVFVLVTFLAIPALAADGSQHFVLTALSVLLMLAPSVLFMYRAYQHCRVDVRTVTNDNSTAIAKFNEALRHAETELLIHDDGDHVKGTVYNDKATIQAVRDRLTEQTQLKIRCLLNFNEGVEMTKLSKEFGPRFQVGYLHQRPTDDVHFKIADRGKWTYLSTHPKGSIERDGEIRDGTHADKYARRYYVSELLEAFEECFEKAQPQ